MRGTLRGSMPKLHRRLIHKDDLPLRLDIARERDGCFYYVIMRQDGTIDRRSPARFATEAQAQAVGSPVLRRRALAARLTRSSIERSQD